MSCTNCGGNNITVKLSEKIVLWSDDESISPIVLNCVMKNATQTVINAPNKIRLTIWDITVKNFNKIKDFIEGNVVDMVQIEGVYHSNFTITRKDKDRFQIIIK